MPEQALLEVRNLRVWFPIRSGLLRRTVDYLHAVDGVTFTVRRGTTVGLVGESGSGKSTTGKAIIRLAPVTGGTILYQGRVISNLSRKACFPLRKSIQMIFQDPFTALNPRMTIAASLIEPLAIHFPKRSSQENRERAAELLDKVGLKFEHLNRYPHEFSGGQRQRIGIARALAVEPELLICDEPVSALDVSVQAQIINLLQDLQDELGLTYLFIAHDLAVVEYISDDVLVMTQGRIVEQTRAEELYRHPQHEYTRRLLAAVPEL
ncbi:MAG: ATP-binding cassette domain-containing protein [Candidatus Competibacteraceae bacterium]